MAKAKRKSKPKEEEFEDEPPPEPAEAEEKPSPDFFQSIGAGLKAAGEAAGRFARMGVGVAELEKLKLELKVAQAKLGDAVLRCWDSAPDIGVAANDPAVKEPARAVRDLRRRIREIEKKITTLKSDCCS